MNWCKIFVKFLVKVCKQVNFAVCTNTFQQKCKNIIFHNKHALELIGNL